MLAPSPRLSHSVGRGSEAAEGGFGRIGALSLPCGGAAGCAQAVGVRPMPSALPDELHAKDCGYGGTVDYGTKGALL